MGYGLVAPVIVRVYRETGREQEAAHPARQRLELLRSERKSPGRRREWDERLRYASLAANEGLREETSTRFAKR